MSIIGLEKYNAKHYCNYYNICKYMYYFLQLSKNLLSTLSQKQNYLINNFLLWSYKDNDKNTIYLCNYLYLEFSQNTDIKDFTLF